MAEKQAYPQQAPSAPAGGFPEAPPSYEATMSGGAGKCQKFHSQSPLFSSMNIFSGGFVDPNKADNKPQYAPPPQGAGVPAGDGPAPQQPTVIVQYMNPPNFGSNPVNMTCPQCQSQIRTSTDSEPGPLAWIIAGLLCVMG